MAENNCYGPKSSKRVFEVSMNTEKESKMKERYDSRRTRKQDFSFIFNRIYILSSMYACSRNANTTAACLTHFTLN